MSIWTGIDRATFERNLKRLQNKPQNDRLLPPLEPSGTLHLEVATLTPQIERRLADDFAFLASRTTAPRDVAAAAIQHLSNPRRLCITIAANEGIKNDVRIAFDGILDALRKCTRLEISSKEAEAKCRDEVVRLHRGRIFERFERSNVQSMRNRLANVIDSAKKASQRQRGEEPALLNQLIALRSAVIMAETALPHSETEQQALRNILRAAYDITANCESLASRIVRLDSSFSPESRLIRHIRGLGNYNQICVGLASLAKEFKEWFGDIELRVLPPEPTHMWQSLQQFVHAEIQLVLAFETGGDALPRYIGASKKPCFLCYTFIRALNRYGIHASHGEVYPQWTVPDRSDCTAQARQQISLALRAVSRECQRASKAALPRRFGWRLIGPLQSVSKLHLPRLSNTSSLTTATALSASTIRAIGNAAHRSLSDVTAPSVADVHNEIIERTSALSLRPSFSRRDESESESEDDTLHTADPTTWYSVCNGECSKISVQDRFDIFFELGNSWGEAALRDTAASYTTAHCSVTPTTLPSVNSVPTVSLADIDEHEHILEVHDHSAPFRFILESEGGTHLVSLRWH